LYKSNVVAKFKYYPDVHDKQRYDLGVHLGHYRGSHASWWNLRDTCSL